MDKDKIRTLKGPWPDVPPAPPPPAYPQHRMDSLHSVGIKVPKSFIWSAVTGGVAGLCTLVASVYPYVHSWEMHQITDVQESRVLYGSKMAPFDERTLPEIGMFDRFESHDSELKRLREQMNEIQTELVDQYKWQVRYQAADAERDSRKRKASADAAESKYWNAIATHHTPQESLRIALEPNPYALSR